MSVPVTDAAEQALSLAYDISAEVRVQPVTRWALADGWAGLALLAAACQHVEPEGDWDASGHRWLALAIDRLERSPSPGPGLFAGMAGVGLAADSLAAGRERYGGLLRRIDAALGTTSDVLAGRCATEPLVTDTADVVSGVAGIARYWLARCERGSGSDDCRIHLERILRALVVSAGSSGLLLIRYTPGRPAPGTPPGAVNLGMAHGTPGGLAVAAAAHRAGYVVPGLEAVVGATASWLVTRVVDVEGAPTWPSWLQTDPRLPHAPVPSRDGWCYGTPGVACALWGAGACLDRSDWCDLALEAMDGVAARYRGGRRPGHRGLCHGEAGLLAVLASFAGRSGGGDRFADVIITMCEELAPRSNPPDPGWLEGDAGVAMALLSAAGVGEWERCLALS